MTNVEFLQLVNSLNFTPDYYEGYDTDDEVDEDEVANFLGDYEQVEEVAELTESYKVIHFAKHNKYLMMYGEYNSYEGYTVWGSRDGDWNQGGNNWVLVEPKEVTITKYFPVND